MVPVVSVALAAVAAVRVAFWYSRRRHVEVPCTVDVEVTPEHMHTHVELEGVLIQPGDEVLLRKAPPRIIPIGTRERYESSAVVGQASWLRRVVTRLTGGASFHELYDVGFEG